MVRVALEGCGHGSLDNIYSSIEHSAKLLDWPTVDLVIICGDFQAVRNGQDLNTMSVPFKYRELGDFHKYYSGQLVAPCLTIFIGGNHEASAHNRELYYGGWAAPNIYYMGAANLLRIGSLRIAGLSGIYKSFDYNRPHMERLPFNQSNVKSIYHIRDYDVRKLLAIRTQVDIGLSHDWPEGIAWLGNYRQLFRVKKGFEEDAMKKNLGSPPAMQVLDTLRPPYWFSGHLHCKYTATKTFAPPAPRADAVIATVDTAPTVAFSPRQKIQSDEIDLDLSLESDENKEDGEEVSSSLRDQLPDSFKRQPSTSPSWSKTPYLPQFTPMPQSPDITNQTVKFLALDKIGPHRQFLQLLEINPVNAEEEDEQNTAPLALSYDPEWLAITRAFGQTNPTTNNPFPFTSASEIEAAIDKEIKWVNANISNFTVPINFEITAPIHDASKGRDVPDMPREYSNPQTVAFCKMVGIENYFYAPEEEQISRQANAPSESRGMMMAQTRNGRGRGGHQRGRGGRGRFHN